MATPPYPVDAESSARKLRSRLKELSNLNRTYTTGGGGGGVTPDADAATKGKLKLAGDLAGTADLPTVPGIAAKAATTYVDAADTALAADIATKANDAAVVHTAGDETVAGAKTFQRLIVELAGLITPGLTIRQSNTVTSTGNTDLLHVLYKTFQGVWLNEKAQLRARRVAAEVVMRVYGRATDPDANNGNDLQQWFGDAGGTDALVARMGAGGKLSHRLNDFSGWAEITIDSPTTLNKYTPQTNGTSGYNSPQVTVVEGGRFGRLRGRINVALGGTSDEVIASALPTSLAGQWGTYSAVPRMNRRMAGYITGAGGQRLEVRSDGTLRASGSVTGGASVFISLDGLSYSLED